MNHINENEIKKALSMLKDPEGIIEVRILEGKNIHSGYFKDIDKLVNALKNYRVSDNANVYITLNKILKACYSRVQQDKILPNVKTTSGNDICGYQWLFIDFDPKRPADISSTDEELELAKKKASKVYEYLRANNFCEPIFAQSGNGYHLLYKVGLSVEDKAMVEKFLKVLSMYFSDDKVDVDVKNSDPNRICKLYGTIAHKGANTPERPHRESKIISAPIDIKKTSKEVIEKIANQYPQEERNTFNYGNRSSFDLDEFISRNGIKINKTKRENGVTKYLLEECLFDSNHKSPDACIFKLDSGALAYKCFHNSCEGHNWREVRMMFEPDAYNTEYVDYRAKPNFANGTFAHKSIKEVSKPLPQGDDGFLTTDKIYEMVKEKPPQEFIKTGINVIDQKMRGLQKGFVSLISGLRASGKSTLLSQLALNIAEQGYKVALYSGELRPEKTLEWLTRQCCGWEGLIKMQEGHYIVRNYAKEKISQYLSDKIYIYNNDYGHSFENLYNSLDLCVATRKADLIILDNLMTIDMSASKEDKYQKQSELVGRLEIFAKKNNVHVILVAHPRKSTGFLRLEDVAGSNDIVNRVDNAFIVHRKNHDFDKNFAIEFPKEELEQCDNIVEICKDRENGNQDVFIPLYYDSTTKRLTNTPKENKNYSWQYKPF